MLLYINMNGDNLLIGRYLGSAALGVYARAWSPEVESSMLEKRTK